MWYLKVPCLYFVHWPLREQHFVASANRLSCVAPEEPTDLRHCAATTTALCCQPYVRQPQELHLAHAAIMALPQSAYKDRQFLAVIGDEVCTRLSEYKECAHLLT